MFDDPLTARILLLAHRREYELGNVPVPLSQKHMTYLHDLNWRERKLAILASFSTTFREFWTCSAPLRKKAERERKEREKEREKEKRKKKLSGNVFKNSYDDQMVPNIFSTLREKQMDCLIIVFSYI